MKVKELIVILSTLDPELPVMVINPCEDDITWDEVNEVGCGYSLSGERHVADTAPSNLSEKAVYIQAR